MGLVQLVQNSEQLMVYISVEWVTCIWFDCVTWSFHEGLVTVVLEGERP